MKLFHNEEIYIKTDNFQTAYLKKALCSLILRQQAFTGESDCLHDRLCKAH